MTDAKWWQKLTLPLARRAKKYDQTAIIICGSSYGNKQACKVLRNSNTNVYEAFFHILFHWWKMSKREVTPKN